MKIPLAFAALIASSEAIKSKLKAQLHSTEEPLDILA